MFTDVIQVIHTVQFYIKKVLELRPLSNRSGSYKIHALPFFIVLVYRFHGNIDYFKNTHSIKHSIKLQLLNLVLFSNRSGEGKVCKKPIENAM